MQTTLRMDDEVLRAAKAAAAEDGLTLTSFIEEAIRRRLEARLVVESAEKPQLPVFAGGGGLRPGVDLDDSAALLEIMDEG